MSGKRREKEIIVAMESCMTLFDPTTITAKKLDQTIFYWIIFVVVTVLDYIYLYLCIEAYEIGNNFLLNLFSFRIPFNSLE